MNRYFLLAALIIALIAGGFFYFKQVNYEDMQTVSTSGMITFPRGGEELLQGETYTLTWTGGIDPVHIFLIDVSLKSEGASVSIADRVYGIRNEQAYDYTIPVTMEPGEYEFQIGNQTSKVFRIISK